MALFGRLFSRKEVALEFEALELPFTAVPSWLEKQKKSSLASEPMEREAQAYGKVLKEKCRQVDRYAVECEEQLPLLREGQQEMRIFLAEAKALSDLTFPDRFSVGVVLAAHAKVGEHLPIALKIAAHHPFFAAFSVSSESVQNSRGDFSGESLSEGSLSEEGTVFAGFSSLFAVLEDFSSCWSRFEQLVTSGGLESLARVQGAVEGLLVLVPQREKILREIEDTKGRFLLAQRKKAEKQSLLVVQKMENVLTEDIGYRLEHFSRQEERWERSLLAAEREKGLMDAQIQERKELLERLLKEVAGRSVIVKV